ncbi:Pr6Pr family membrane protein [Sphingobium aromaticiconvertens]|uniref:Pr6Pr family membrane protein n=1 Tax=Sphingobium aromaticiconvertens TaxID=365341 RepID=UPI003018C3F8
MTRYAPPSTTARIAALAVAAVACTGLGVQFIVTFHGTANGDVVTTLWTLLRFFTIWANIVVAIVMSGVALGQRWARRPVLLGGATLSILLVGIVYGLLLRGMIELSGGALLTDTLLHKVTPILLPLWWLVFASKGQLNWGAPWIWMLFPLTYLPYALLRGLVEGKYAYPFINVTKLGWAGVSVNAALIALGFIVAGYGVVWVDRRLGRTRVKA